MDIERGVHFMMSLVTKLIKLKKQKPKVVKKLRLRKTNDVIIFINVKLFITRLFKYYTAKLPNKNYII